MAFDHCTKKTCGRGGPLRLKNNLDLCRTFVLVLFRLYDMFLIVFGSSIVVKSGHCTSYGLRQRHRWFSNLQLVNTEPEVECFNFPFPPKTIKSGYACVEPSQAELRSSEQRPQKLLWKMLRGVGSKIDKASNKAHAVSSSSRAFFGFLCCFMFFLMCLFWESSSSAQALFFLGQVD